MLQPNGVTANDGHIMVTFEPENWEQWQELALAARNRTGLTSFPLDLGPGNNGLLGFFNYDGTPLPW